MTKSVFNLSRIHPSWHDCIQISLKTLDPDYLNTLAHETWLPGADKIFNAFSLPLNKVNYVLFGESPYPRAASANGYAFWDQAVTELWSSTGLSKAVNRATSLRNIIKMLLLARGDLKAKHMSQADIAAVDKTHLIHSNSQFFNHLLEQGFLLLNATPVLSSLAPQKEAKYWQPFMKSVLHYLFAHRKQATLLLFGRIANNIEALLPHLPINKVYAPHPYNLSFITNPQILDFFKPLDLLKAHKNDT